MTIFVRPAYGRKYDKVGDVAADWKDGKDFKIVGGPYCSKRDFEGEAQLDSVVYAWDGLFWHLETSVIS